MVAGFDGEQTKGERQRDYSAGIGKGRERKGMKTTALIAGTMEAMRRRECDLRVFYVALDETIVERASLVER